MADHDVTGSGGLEPRTAGELLDRRQLERPEHRHAVEQAESGFRHDRGFVGGAQDRPAEGDDHERHGTTRDDRPARTERTTRNEAMTGPIARAAAINPSSRPKTRPRCSAGTVR